MASSVATCLRSLGYDVPRLFDVMPLLDIDGIVEALTVQLQDMGSCFVLSSCSSHSRCCFLYL